jgi:hypothetical protein
MFPFRVLVSPLPNIFPPSKYKNTRLNTACDMLVMRSVALPKPFLAGCAQVRKPRRDQVRFIATVEQVS